LLTFEKPFKTPAAALNGYFYLEEEPVSKMGYSTEILNIMATSLANDPKERQTIAQILRSDFM
jgi:hypothetical protein